MITIKDKAGREIQCHDAAEAIAILQHLEAKDNQATAKAGAPIGELLSALFLGDKKHTPYWTREMFWQFIDALGESQKSILMLLVQRHRLTDDEMRKAVGVKTNLELGGILSGISKQAAAHNIPARAVYTIENESQGGETKKTYVVALDFLRIATEMNWPE